MKKSVDKSLAGLTQLRTALVRWWSGLAFRISFFMTIPLVIMGLLVGAFFTWESGKRIDAEIRSRGLYAARQLAAAYFDDIAAKDRPKLAKKIKALSAQENDPLLGSALLYAIIYDDRGAILAQYSDKAAAQAELAAPLFSGSGPLHPVFAFQNDGVYDLIFPVTSEAPRGFIRLGISRPRYSDQFGGLMMTAGVTLFCILLVGLAFSRIIALVITKPISRLSDAVQKIGRHKWDMSLSPKGPDEISRLSQAFNEMALTLKEREARLSRGNGDLFLLHTAGVDLMESLDREALLTKIVAHVEDLTRSENTAISTINNPGAVLSYLQVVGSKADAIKERELPLEAGGIYNWLVSYGTPLLIEDAESDFRLDKDLMQTMGIKSMIVVPLWSGNMMTGLLTVINKKGGTSFDRHDLRLLTVFSSLAAAALQNAVLYSDLRAKMNELETAQEQLIHSTKMAAIGELSANVAHEINNPLTSVLGYTTHLLKTLPLPEGPTQILKMMEHEMLRVRRFIRNLLDFARDKPSWMQPSDITVPLRETKALVQGMAEASAIKIHESYPASPMLVNMDHNEMKQVFINIVNNALQAMPDGGELRIAMKDVNEHELAVEFSDTGYGIKQENADKIFKPFFSTKKTGEGTGLGLSISQRIVQNHGGRIEMQSTDGNGTVFKVILPRYERAQRSKSLAAGNSDTARC